MSAISQTSNNLCIHCIYLKGKQTQFTDEMGILTRVLVVRCELGAHVCSVNKDLNRIHENYLPIENVSSM